MEQRVQGSGLEPRPARDEQWRIILEAPKDEEQPARFAVLRDERRVA